LNYEGTGSKLQFQAPKSKLPGKLPIKSWLSHVPCPMSNVSVIFYVLISWSLFSLHSATQYSSQHSLNYICNCNISFR